MKKNKTTIITMLFLAIFAITIVYGAFSSSFTITGSGSIGTTWNVGFDTTTTTGDKTECTVTSKDSGKATTCTISTKTANNIGATIAWASPGDVVTLKVRVNNSGTLKASHSVSAKYHLTGSTTTSCASTVTATGNYKVGTTTGTAQTLGTTAKTIGPMTLDASGGYGMYTFVFTYSSSATTGAYTCTFSASGSATQVA